MSNATDDSSSVAEEYDPYTSQEDILACFRLLLGRNINEVERAGHFSMVGQPLTSVVPIYLDSLEFARRDLLKPSDLSAIEFVQFDDFGIYASNEDASVGRYIVAKNFEPDVTAVFRRTLRPGMNVIDIGANVGYFTMLSAAAVGQSGTVLAVEPNPVNARLLEASRRANGFANVTLAQVGAGRETGLLVLNAGQSNGMTSSPSSDLGALLSSATVPAVTIDSLAYDRPPIDFIKIDVEGAEYNALLGASATIARDRPIIVSEFSPEQMPGISGIDGEGYLQFLISSGYDLGVIMPDGAVEQVGENWEAVMNLYRARSVDHVDIVATARR